MVVQGKEAVSRIKNLLEKQPLAVLATQGNGQPYTSLMAYAFTDDLRYILLATAMSTRKHRNILGESRVALLVDDRSNNEKDFEKAAALTITGEACETKPNEREDFTTLFLRRHPSLENFLGSPSTFFFKIEVHKYLLVSKFEEVVEYSVRSEG